MNPIAWAALCGFVVATLLVTFLTGYRAAQNDCRERVMLMDRSAVTERARP